MNRIAPLLAVAALLATAATAFSCSDDRGGGVDAASSDSALPGADASPNDAGSLPDAAIAHDASVSSDAELLLPDSGGAASDAAARPDATPFPDADSPIPADASIDAGAATLDAASGQVPDPNQDGPYSYQTIDTTIDVAASGDRNVPIHCAYPTSGPENGPFPVVVVAHGLSLSASEYYGYVSRLASFGYVALTVDFPSSAFSTDNPGQAQDLLAGLDWAKSQAVLDADADHSGMTGHSLGGKLALLAATMDSRVVAAILLDPVDGGGPAGCSAPSCVEVAPLMPNLHIPTGFIGETTDSTGGMQPCAPAASNYTTFYAKANSPSVEITAIGADHMSFLDDVSSCGLMCSLCTQGTAPNAQVNGMARAFVVAFYERWIRGNADYDTYLTGAAAQGRYVVTGEATITSK